MSQTQEDSGLEEKQTSVTLEEKTDELNENNNLESQLPESFRAMLNAQGPTVKAVVLKQDGTSIEIDYDTTPSKMEASKILGAPPTIIGQYHELEVILVRGRFSENELEQTLTETEKDNNNNNSNSNTNTSESESESENKSKIGINKHSLRWPYDKEEYYGDLFLYRIDENGNAIDFTLNEYNEFYSKKEEDIKLEEEWQKQCEKDPSLNEPFSLSNMFSDCIKDDFDMDQIDENDNENENENEEEESETEREVNKNNKESNEDECGISGIEEIDNMGADEMIGIDQLKSILEKQIRKDLMNSNSNSEPNNELLAKLVEASIKDIMSMDDEYNPSMDNDEEDEDEDDEDYNEEDDESDEDNDDDVDEEDLDNGNNPFNDDINNDNDNDINNDINNDQKDESLIDNNIEKEKNEVEKDIEKEVEMEGKNDDLQLKAMEMEKDKEGKKIVNKNDEKDGKQIDDVIDNTKDVNKENDATDNVQQAKATV